jgi:DMSO/TMAO reductase YedYZ molybdopterin-dependent catalytic subunit
VASAAGLLVSFAVYGLSLAAADRALARKPVSTAEPMREGRAIPRRALVLGGVGVVLAAVAGVLTRSLYRRATFGAFGYDGLKTRGPRVDPITPNDRFYVVTKNLIDPIVDAGPWRLEVRGRVDRPHTYSFDQLAGLPTTTQLTTLECISNPVGGGLMSNAEWRGVPLATVLSAARPQGGTVEVVMHAADGYVHALSLEKAMDPNTLLAFIMNGSPLPHRHGYPVRALVPGAYGEVSVKWLDRIDVVDRPVLGYYEKQGWKPQLVNTASRIDRPGAGQKVPAGPIDVGGVAFAGDRGISLVEFSSDGGATWVPARIDYQPSALAWVLWSYAWRPELPGHYRLTVRAADGTGSRQTAEERGSAPSGSTGYHHVDVEIV